MANTASKRTAYVYCVTSGSKWRLTRNKRQALAYIREHGGDVRRMELQAYKDGGSWDWPTFQALSELVTYAF